MPTFDTPEPITAAIDVVAGAVRIVAADRADTVVRVEPSDPSHEPDVRAADDTKVDYTAGRLVVKGPRQRGLGMFGDKVGQVDVTVELPTGSHVRGDAAVGNFVGSGTLGECRIKTSAGNVELADTGPLTLATSAGSVDVGRVDGPAEITTGSGGVRVGGIDGACSIQNSNGATWVGESDGELRVKAANGAITVDQAHSGVTAHTAYGDVRVVDAVRGTLSLSTAFGGIDIGIHPGTAAHLDVSTSFGHVHNDLRDADAPPATVDTLEVHARTSYGDVTIRRA